ncbi:RHS repeat protein, partial [Salmonella enterica subsp. enterica serovar Stanleyville]|nr:RHS repeat protein [Salmonella enterica subsp. enterica serovar Stanleyville]
DMPLVEYTRDRLHREVLRRFGAGAAPEAGAYELTTTYTPGGQLHGQHLTLPQLNREYGYDEGGRLVRISGPQQTREYRYSESGRLTGVHTSAANLDITLPYATDPAGNRLPDPEFYPDSASTVWADNRITEDMQYLYRYDKYGRLTEKTDRIPEGVVIRMNDERTHRYEYDNQHRLVHYVRTQHGETQAEGRYLYDPLGRRVGKRVWKRELVHWSDTRMELSRRPYVTWYGWEGDRLTTIQTGQRRIQTVYAPGSFTPLVRIETDAAEQAKAQHRSLAEKLSQEGSEDGQAVQLPAALTAMLDRLEGELRRNTVSEESRQWLAGCGLTPEQMAGQLEPEYTPQRKIHLYHCDHRGLPLALITLDNQVAWRAEYDEWGNQLNEENPHHMEQLIRLPGQQYDEESGLYYNRHRYYNPGQGRYITQDPIGLKGGWNLYQYPLNPVVNIDPLGLLRALANDAKGVAEAILPKYGPAGIHRARIIKNDAEDFGENMDKYVGGSWNGHADALRHCYLMCAFAKEFGHDIAKRIGDNHERNDVAGIFSQQGNETTMDLNNNAVGLACAKSSDDCSSSCIQKYYNGELYDLNGLIDDPKLISPTLTNEWSVSDD